ncbi:GNAT family N-acetyltransferase [Oenococcus oeni]|uniref:Acetyltransferase n=13 Tax=Oenococcus oeni TaxID=1247 RepID=Q04GV4_OENOB|nr:GNAT family N-acetyltransferase [Oenococcus oeni]ABJ56318.1 Acetyltransferase [Oenococcus oeni PSU-1]KZD13027.1 Acetyltransferase [Oenococcus oeni]OIK68702.1 GNAT family N-acetyltransferase [Oenococcus oeni]OIL15760.1 GNAT family N-acetyltransferase [Oenococcus oeni]OIL29999.1 GNAT family N-acetyltransferase [Oenococcus oeni]
MNKYLLGENEFDKFYDLYLYSFNRQDSSQRKRVFKERYDHSLSYGIMNGSKLGSGLFSIPFEVNFHGVDYKMNGIGDVMSAPEFGGQGGAGKLMNEALFDMYKNHVTLSYLAPFSFGYYRRFGFEQVFDHTQVEIKSESLPRIKNAEHGHVERISIKGIPDELKKMYLDHNDLGGVNRSKWWWNHMLDKHSDYQAALAYDDDDVLIGYLIYYNQDQTFYIHEWINLNPLSRQLLAKFVIKHQSIFSKFVYESPNPDFKSDILDDPYTTNLTVTPYMMARIVNLGDFLQRYPIQVNSLEKIYFRVKDTLEWNDHTWALEINDGKVKLSDADGEGADLELTIQTLTKAMFGYRNLNSLADYGAVKGDLSKINSLSKVFVSERPQLIDYF